jgi:8-oxo-dGTP pyrophosphatase MutT (NUDIX family)
MGAGILPTTIYKGKLYFLFGKENRYADTPGWADFGGGTDNNETPLRTAIREGVEETTGFLGNEMDVRRFLSRGTYSIENDGGRYTMFLFQLPYDEQLPHYYNNNQRFLQKRLDPKIIQQTKIFEKSEIKWVCIDDLGRMRNQFRHYFRAIVDKLLDQQNDIYTFIRQKKNRSSRQTRRHHSG